MFFITFVLLELLNLSCTFILKYVLFTISSFFFQNEFIYRFSRKLFTHVTQFIEKCSIMCKGMKLEIVDLWIRVYGKKSIYCINILYKLYKHSINW